MVDSPPQTTAPLSFPEVPSWAQRCSPWQLARPGLPASPVAQAWGQGLLEPVAGSGGHRGTFASAPEELGQLWKGLWTQGDAVGGRHGLSAFDLGAGGAARPPQITRSSLPSQAPGGHSAPGDASP